MKRVLVVDDQSLIRNVLRLILEQQGYECIEAENGYEAWTWLFEPLPIDLILTDNHMPIMTGLQLIRKIKSVRNLDYLPIVLLSGTLTEELIREAQEMGVDAVLAKPLNVPDLVKVVSGKLSGETDLVKNDSPNRAVGSSHCAIL